MRTATTRAWSAAALAGCLLLGGGAGCGRISDTHHPPGNPHTVRTGKDDLPLITITIENGRVSPPPGRVEVKQGEQVRLSVTSDRADTVHVHGFDIERPLAAGEEVTLELVADRAGVFAVETHDAHLVLTQLAVR